MLWAQLCHRYLNHVACLNDQLKYSSDREHVYLSFYNVTDFRKLDPA